MTAILRQRGWERPARLIMVTVATSSGLAPATMLAEPRRVDLAQILVGVGGALVCTALAWFWLTRWPTRTQSAVVAVVGITSITVWSLSQSWPTLAALGCSAFAVLGSYIAFFHSNRLLVLHATVTLAATWTAIARLAHVTSVVTAIAGFWLLTFLNLTLPLAMRAVSRAMAQYAHRAHLDPLTGLLNRRGFFETMHAELALDSYLHTDLSILMVDLDDFKSINDTHGHETGDDVLRAVAVILQDAHSGSTICRAGGEEFLVAVVGAAGELPDIAERLRGAIAQLPHSVSASIGTSSVRSPRARNGDRAGVIDGLIRTADAAMYVAKRNGGNQIAHG